MTTGLSANTFTHLQLNAGVLLKNFAHSSITDKAALKTALATAIAGDGCLGATKGGGSFDAKPTVREIEADGMRSSFVGSTILDGWEISLKASLIEVTAENLALALGPVKKTTVASKTTLELKNSIGSSDYIDTICWVGDLADGGYVLIEIDNALAVGGISFTFDDKAEGTIPLELKAHADSVSADEVAPCRVVFF